MKSRFVLAAALMLFLMAASLQPSRGALIIFNDGFVVSGKVLQPRQVEIDSGIPFSVPSGFMYVDDGARRIIFTPSASQVAEVLREDPADRDLIRIARPAPNRRWLPLPPWRIEKIGPWDKNWERIVTFDNPRLKPVRQRISMLSTQGVRIYTIGEDWAPSFKINEFDPQTVRKLLSDYLNRKKEYPESRKRIEIFRFLFQAGWYEAAEQELQKMVVDFPEEKSSAEPYWTSLKKVRAAQLVADLERLHKIGQHDAAQKVLQAFFKDDDLVKLAGDKQAVAQDLKNQYESAAKKLKEVQRLLKDLPGRLKADPGKVLADAAKEIGREINLDTVARLETFLTYARYHERQLKENKKLSQQTDQVLALALTGWMRGDTGADFLSGPARSLWQLRKLLLTRPVKSRDITSFCAKERLDADVVAQIIPLLPPPDAPEIKNIPMKFDLDAPDSTDGEYWVQLPPEYHPNRSYPVLLLLHAPGEGAIDLLRRFSELGKRHGFILAAPLWGKGLRPQYHYTAQEHALVLDTIRDLRRRFGVDSDRVFLYGWRTGGNMAYDIGLAHPDQFAGVLPQNASTRYFPERYWPNAQYLPFYIVEGDMNGDGPRENRKMVADWIRGGYPFIYIEYKGRGSEWFAGELPVMFDWMNRKKRAHPTRALGRYSSGADGEEFKSMRDGDNRFYWISADGIFPGHINSAKNWAKLTPPAKFTATLMYPGETDFKLDRKHPKIDPKNLAVDKVRIWNQINVRCEGAKQVTIWLGPNMIDFTKPVRLYRNGYLYGKDRKIQPNLSTLLEDFLYSWDRQRLFLAKIELR